MNLSPETFAMRQTYLETNRSLMQRKEQIHAERVVFNAERARIKTLKNFDAYKQKQEEIERLKDQAATNNSVYVPAEPHFFLVIRIRGMNRVPPKQRKTLDLLRLRRPNTAVLIKNNKSTRAMLQLVRNYVGFGFISLNTLRELVYKRGLTNVEKNDKGINITNEMIEKKFGDLLCMEDLVYSLWMDENFVNVNRFLAPFRLNCPKGGFKGRKAVDFLMGGSCGNHYEMIDELVKRMIN